VEDWRARNKRVCKCIANAFAADEKTLTADLRAYEFLLEKAQRADWLSILNLKTRPYANLGYYNCFVVAGRLRLCYEKKHELKRLTVANIFRDAHSNCDQFRASLLWAKLAFEISRQIEPGPSSILVGTSLMMLAMAQKCLGFFGKGSTLTQQAMAMFEQAEAKGKVAQAATELGDILIEQGKFEEAKPFLQKALRIGEREFASPALLNQEALAEVYGEYSKFQTASHQYDKALMFMEKKHGIITGYYKKHLIHNNHDLTWVSMQIGILIWAQTRALAWKHVSINSPVNL